MAITWLHISDLHLQDGEQYDQSVVLKALVKSVKSFIDRGRKPDLIFVTGDIAKSGKAPQ